MFKAPVLLFAALFCFSILVFCNGAVFDPYSRRYNINKQQVYPLLLNRISGQSALVKGLKDAYNKSSTSVTYTAAESANFLFMLQEVESWTTNPIYTTTADQKRILFNGLHHGLLWSAPNIYNNIKYLNMSINATLGGPPTIPIDHIFYIQNEANINLAWNIIKAPSTSGSGKCKAWDRMVQIMADFGPTAQSAFVAKYNPVLCQVKPNTMTQWYALLRDTILTYPYQQYYFDWNPVFYLDDFIRAAKSYRPDLYASYFTPLPPTNNYTAVDGMMNVLKLTNYTNTQKGFVKNLANYFLQQYTTLPASTNYPTPDSKLINFSMKFSESIDLSYSYYSCLGGIDYQNDTAKFLDIIMWTSQRTTLQLAYTAAGGI